MSTGSCRTAAARRAASATERDFATFENLGNVEEFQGFEEEFEALAAAGSSSGYGYSSSNGYTSRSTMPSADGLENFEVPQSSCAVRRAWSVIERGPATSPSTIECGAPGAWSAIRVSVSGGGTRSESFPHASAANLDDDNDNDDGVMTAWPVQQHWQRECAARGVSTEKPSGGEQSSGRKSPRNAPKTFTRLRNLVLLVPLLPLPFPHFPLPHPPHLLPQSTVFLPIHAPALPHSFP
ncbi:unnamed protein product [Closterium sp. Naga37s-1]|nr:unnamed protein product [Closterium sp. Naga37s-1]